MQEQQGLFSTKGTTIPASPQSHVLCWQTSTCCLCEDIIFDSVVLCRSGVISEGACPQLTEIMASSTRFTMTLAPMCSTISSHRYCSRLLLQACVATDALSLLMLCWTNEPACICVILIAVLQLHCYCCIVYVYLHLITVL